jgi:hypothetical protein
MYKNVASQKVQLFAFVPSTGLPKTGDAANITPYVSKDHGTVTVLGTTTATEMDATNAKGLYLFTLTQAETNANTLTFTAKSTSSDVAIVPRFFSTRPPNESGLLIDSNGSVTLADGGLTAAKIAADAFTSAKFQDGFLTAAKIANDAITAAKIAADAIGASELAADAATEIVTAIFARAFSAGYSSLTFDQLLKVMVAVLAGKVSGAATTTETFRNLADSANVVVATVDASGNRSALTLTP